MPSILVSGPVRGNFAALFKAIAKAQKKGEFAAALCVGNFLGETRDAPADGGGPALAALTCANHCAGSTSAVATALASPRARDVRVR